MFHDSYITEFEKSILAINENAIFCLVILVDKSDEDFLVVKGNHFLKINISTLSNLIPQERDYPWTCPHIDWSKIFNIIKTNIDF